MAERVAAMLLCVFPCWVQFLNRDSMCRDCGFIQLRGWASPADYVRYCTTGGDRTYVGRQNVPPRVNIGGKGGRGAPCRNKPSPCLSLQLPNLPRNPAFPRSSHVDGPRAGRVVRARKYIKVSTMILPWAGLCSSSPREFISLQSDALHLLL